MKLHNTLGDALQELKPLDGKKVRFYSCGLTVYGQPHIGNWVGYIYWDVLKRALAAEGFEVEHTQNITDVGHLTSDDDEGEDKMEKGARREGITAWDVAKKYSLVADQEAYELLGLTRPDHLVPATRLIEKQVEFAKILEKKGYTYTIPNEGLYFDTSKLKDYGKLARLDIAGLEGGIRVAIDGKKNITDFAIWKFSPKDSKRDMEWDSPWGKGFPGWHLECSVIARETLGDQIDIHSGGIDHIPVHHTNEIAQTESVTGKQFSTFWIHNNHIKIDGEKISKSIGNVVTLQDILDHGHTMDGFKLMILSKHYRTEGNFTWEILGSAQNRLNHWRNVAALRHQTHDTLKDNEGEPPSLAVIGKIKEALTDDLDTPETLKYIDESFSSIHPDRLNKVNREHLVELLETIDELLGLRLMQTTPDIPDEAKQVILRRRTAREQKNWEVSDELRDELEANYHIEILDTPHGQVWQYN